MPRPRLPATASATSGRPGATVAGKGVTAVAGMHVRRRLNGWVMGRQADCAARPAGRPATSGGAPDSGIWHYDPRGHRLEAIACAAEATAISISSVAVLHLQQRQYRESEALFREALAVFETRSGPIHPLTFTSKANLAWVLADEGRWSEAERLSRDAVSGLTRAVPAGHWLIAHAQSVLGQCLAARGRNAEAESLLTRSYPVIASAQGGFFARAALERLIAFHERAGNAARAAEYRALLAR